MQPKLQMWHNAHSRYNYVSEWDPSVESLLRKFRTASIPYTENSIRRKFRTVKISWKFHTTKSPYGKNSVRQKSPYGVKSYGENSCGKKCYGEKSSRGKYYSERRTVQIILLYFIFTLAVSSSNSRNLYMYECLMCTTKLNNVYNVSCLWITDNLIHHMEPLHK